MGPVPPGWVIWGLLNPEFRVKQPPNDPTRGEGTPKYLKILTKKTKKMKKKTKKTKKGGFGNTG